MSTFCLSLNKKLTRIEWTMGESKRGGWGRCRLFSCGIYSLGSDKNALFCGSAFVGKSQVFGQPCHVVYIKLCFRQQFFAEHTHTHTVDTTSYSGHTTAVVLVYIRIAYVNHSNAKLAAHYAFTSANRIKLNANVRQLHKFFVALPHFFSRIDLSYSGNASWQFVFVSEQVTVRLCAVNNDFWFLHA